MNVFYSIKTVFFSVKCEIRWIHEQDKDLTAWLQGHFRLSLIEQVNTDFLRSGKSHFMALQN